jgi:putative flippase GtrA
MKRESLLQLFVEARRFIVVGVAAVAIQYGVYLLLLQWLQPVVANTLGYIVSFLFNYIASTKYTFRVKSSARHGVGFAFSHLVNYILQSLLLVFFLWTGLQKGWAMLPVFAICVPTNFVLVRYFLKH